MLEWPLTGNSTGMPVHAIRSSSWLDLAGAAAAAHEERGLPLGFQAAGPGAKGDAH